MFPVSCLRSKRVYKGTQNFIRVLAKIHGVTQQLRYRDKWGDPDVDGRIILRWILRKWEGVVGNGWSGLRIGTGGGHL
jgi:hypothetical protein